MNHRLLELTWNLYKTATFLDQEDGLVKHTIDYCYGNLATHYGVSKVIIKKVLERLYEDCYNMYWNNYTDKCDKEEYHYSFISFLRSLFDEELYNYLDKVKERRTLIKEG